MIGYRLLPEHVEQLSFENKVELVRWLSVVCGLNVEGILALDMLHDDIGITMEAHVRDTKFSGVVGTNVIDVKTFKLEPKHNVPAFLVKQFATALPVPADGLGDVVVTFTKPGLILPR